MTSLMLSFVVGSAFGASVILFYMQCTYRYRLQQLQAINKTNGQRLKKLEDLLYALQEKPAAAIVEDEDDDYDVEYEGSSLDAIYGERADLPTVAGNGVPAACWRSRLCEALAELTTPTCPGSCGSMTYKELICWVQTSADIDRTEDSVLRDLVRSARQKYSEASIDASKIFLYKALMRYAGIPATDLEGSALLQQILEHIEEKARDTDALHYHMALDKMSNLMRDIGTYFPQ